MVEKLERNSFAIPAVAPFRLDYTVWVLRRRAHNEVDRWVHQRYERIFQINDEPFAVSVVQTAFSVRPEVSVTIDGTALDAEIQEEVESRLNRMVGLDKNLAKFYGFAGKDPVLQPLVERFLGVKPPMFGTVFEALVVGFACQQITLTLGIYLVNRLTQKYGAPFKSSRDSFHAFPNPKRLARLDPDSLRPLGFSKNKSRFITGLSKAVVAGTLDLEGFRRLRDDQARAELRQIKGVGPWTADYVLLRGLGRQNVFPTGDVGARNHLEEWLASRKAGKKKDTQRILESWKPFAGLIYLHLLLQSLREKGIV